MTALELSGRDLAIVDALAHGKSAKQIAEKANAKEETVREQIAAIQQKLGADTQADIHQRFVEVTGWSGSPKDYAPFPPEG